MNFSETLRLPNGEHVSLTWETDFKNVRVSQLDKELAFFEDKNALFTGKNFKTVGGELLSLNVDDKGLACWHDGKDLFTGLKSGATDDFATACGWLMGYGGLQFVGLAILAFLSKGNSEFFGLMIGAAIVGGALVGLGYWAKQSGEKWPLYAGIVVLVLNLFGILIQGRTGGGVITGVLIWQMIKGVRAEPLGISKRKNYDENEPLDANL